MGGRETSSLVSPAKNCHWFQLVGHNGPSVIRWTTPCTFQGMSELQGDTLASSFPKAAFILLHAILQHKLSKCTFWEWHQCLQEREASTQLYTGVYVVKHVSGKLSVQKRSALYALFWELGATSTAAQWRESKQEDQIGQLNAEVSGRPQLQIFCRT